MLTIDHKSNLMAFVGLSNLVRRVITINFKTINNIIPNINLTMFSITAYLN